MAIHGDGDGDKGPSVQEDSAARDRQSDDPYIVFGYGSLIFRVRFPEHCLRHRPLRLGSNELLNPSYFLTDRRADGCVVAPTSCHQKEYAYSSLSLSLLLSGHSIVRARWARVVLGFMNNISHRIAGPFVACIL